MFGLVGRCAATVAQRCTALRTFAATAVTTPAAAASSASSSSAPPPPKAPRKMRAPLIVDGHLFSSLPRRLRTAGLSRRGRSRMTPEEIKLSEERRLTKVIHVRPWTMCHDIDLVHLVHDKARETLMSFVPPVDVNAILPPIPHAWKHYHAAETLRLQLWHEQNIAPLATTPTGADGPAEKRPQPPPMSRSFTDAERQQYWERRGEVVEFARLLRERLTEADAYPIHRVLRSWCEDLRVSAAHTAMQCLMHFDLMSDPRTNLKPRIPTSAPSEASGSTFRSILRHIFFHLPRREGTWVDATREMERLASNSREVLAWKAIAENGTEYGVTASPTYLAGLPLYPNDDSSSVDSSVDDSAERSIDDAISTATLSQPELASGSLMPEAPAPFALSMTMAQGRYQGLTYERSIRATLSRYDEFIVVRKEKMPIAPRAGEKLMASRHNAVYGLDLEVLQILLQAEQGKLERSDARAHRRELARIRAEDPSAPTKPRRGRPRKIAPESEPATPAPATPAPEPTPTQDS